MLITRTLAIAIGLTGLAGCEDRPRGGSAKSPAGQAHADKGHDHADAEHHHAHTAPHGGTIVELEDEVANLELLLDPEHGKLDVWIFNGCLDRPVRVKQEEIELVAMLPGSDGQGESVFTLKLAARVNPLTGETAGDTSQFTATSADLKNVQRFKGVLSFIAIRTTEYRDVSFNYPGATTITKDHDDDHVQSDATEAPQKP